jgi:hypothetical protein
MAELKTKATEQSVENFLANIPDAGRRSDCQAVLEMMKQVTGHEPRMWGSTIIGFGDRHYRYESGHEGDTFLVGFSPRKQNLTLYISPAVEAYRDLLDGLGKHKTGKGCVYINRLADVDLAVLRKLIRQAADWAAAATSS